MSAGRGQRQDSLYDQIVDVLTWARENGCYDAYDWIADRFADFDWALIDGHLRPPAAARQDYEVKRLLDPRHGLRMLNSHSGCFIDPFTTEDTSTDGDAITPDDASD